MATQSIHTKSARMASTPTLKAIFEELRLLRGEIALLLPHEGLEEYSHPERIKQSYARALKQHPPVALL